MVLESFQVVLEAKGHDPVEGRVRGVSRLMAARRGGGTRVNGEGQTEQLEEVRIPKDHVTAHPRWGHAENLQGVGLVGPVVASAVPPTAG